MAIGDNVEVVGDFKDSFVFKNQRPENIYFKERDAFEANCRGDYPSVLQTKQKNDPIYFRSFNILIFLRLRQKN